MTDAERNSYRKKISVRVSNLLTLQEDVVIYKSVGSHFWLPWDAPSPWAAGSPSYIQRHWKMQLDILCIENENISFEYIIDIPVRTGLGADAVGKVKSFDLV